MDASPRTGISVLDSRSFDEVLFNCNPFDDGTCTFDLSSVRLVTPAGQVQLAAACQALAAEGRTPTIVLHDPSVRSYLARAGFVTVVGEVAQFDPVIPLTDTSAYGIWAGSNPMLIELTKVQTGTDLPNLLDRVVWVLRNRLKYRKYDAFDIATAVSEIGQNTFDHNRRTCGFLAMQVYGKGRKSFLEIGVADHGAGLAATLGRNPKVGQIAGDADAIDLATRLGVSGYDDPTRGTGLYHLLEIAFKHEGSVTIRSGCAKVRFRMDRRTGWTFSVPKVPGVQVALQLRSKVGAT